VDVIHPGRAPVSKKDLREHIAKLHKADAGNVIVYGFSTAFGGGRSTGFALIYDSVDDMKKFEPRCVC
jgi:ribosomal protein S24E